MVLEEELRALHLDPQAAESAGLSFRDLKAHALVTHSLQQNYTNSNQVTPNSAFLWTYGG